MFEIDFFWIDSQKKMTQKELVILNWLNLKSWICVTSRKPA